MNSVLILGGTSDIGFALANVYAREGCSIILAGRNKEQLRRNQSDLEIKYDVKVEIVPFNGVDFKDHEKFIQNLPFETHLTICTFGYMGEQTVAFENVEESLKVIHSNFTGYMTILNTIAKNYLENRNGGIIAISGIDGDRGRQSNFIYGSAKSALSTYLQGLRNMLHPFGIHVLTVKPGLVKSKLTERFDFPSRFTASPEEVAEKTFYAYKKRKNVVYIKWFWKYIMLGVKLMPDRLYRRIKI